MDCFAQAGTGLGTATNGPRPTLLSKLCHSDWSWSECDSAVEEPVVVVVGRSRFHHYAVATAPAAVGMTGMSGAEKNGARIVVRALLCREAKSQ